MAKEREQTLISKKRTVKAGQRASEHWWNKGLLYLFCIPYFSVHALGTIFELVHNRMALSATLKLIKRKQIHGAPGNKIPWVDSRRDNVEEEALKIKVVVEFWQLLVPGWLIPYVLWKLLISCLFLPLFLPPWSLLSLTFAVLLSWKSLSSHLSSKAQWDATQSQKSWETNWNCTLYKDIEE